MSIDQISNEEFEELKKLLEEIVEKYSHIKKFLINDIEDIKNENEFFSLF